jgi:hypothetical protein
MAGIYTVKQGDCLSSLADKFGFANYRTIYDHPNNAAFRKKRPVPNILYPGDRLYIPDVEHKQQACATDLRHKFVRYRAMVKLRIRLLDRDRQPYKYKKFAIQVDSSNKIASGHTTETGLAETLIPAGARTGTLKLWLTSDPNDDASLEMPLNLGHLDPVDEISGVQARLNHLRFPCGATDGVLGPKTEAALKKFQKESGLEETGQIDDPTRAKLTSLHDNE